MSIKIANIYMGLHQMDCLPWNFYVSIGYANTTKFRNS
jgi:hypothetical protein